MLTGAPFPRLHAKAAETKALLQPVSVALQHFRDQKPQEAELVDAMVSVLDCSHAIDKVVDGMRGFSVTPAAAKLGQHMSPRLAWCYQGEDLMQKVKLLAQGSFRGTSSRILGNKILDKYLLGVSKALSK